MSPDPLMEQYDSVRYRVSTMAEGAGEAIGLPVPACPEWTGHDLVCHLAGIAADWAEQRLDDYGSDAWTERQIARFDGHDLAAVLRAWHETIPPLMTMGEVEPMGRPSTWLFGDAVVHEADLRPVLLPGTRVPDEPVELATKAGIARLRHHVAEHGLEPLRVCTTTAAGPGREWAVGNLEGFHNEVEVDGYDLFRALYGRRSAAQVRSWGWTGDPEPYIEAGLPYPFSWARDPLND